MATILDCLKKMRLVNPDNTYDRNNAENISRFLNRLLALEIDDQELVFNELDSIMHTVIEHAKEEGTYDSGLEDIPISNMKILQNLHIGTFTIYKVSGNLPSNKTPFAVVEKRLLKETGTVYQCNATNTLFLARDSFNTYNFGSYERVYRLSSPQDYRHKIESATTLNDQTKYTKLENIDLIKQLWEKQYNEAPREIEKEFHILTGSILDHWKIIKSNLQKINIVRVGTGKNRIVGVLINEQTATSLLSVSSSNKQKSTLYKKLFVNNEIVTLNTLNIKLLTRKIYGNKVITLAPIKGEQDSMSTSFIPNKFLKYLMVNGKFVTYIQKEHTDDFIELASKYYLSDINTTQTQTNTQEQHKPLDLRPFKTQNPQSEIRNPKSTIDNPHSTIPNPHSTIPNPHSTITNPHSQLPPKKIVFEEQLSLFEFS